MDGRGSGGCRGSKGSRARWGRRSAAAVIAATIALALAGCGSAVRIGPPPCLPAPLVVAPAEVQPGGSLTVSSPPADCDLAYADGHTYRITVGVRETRTSEVEVQVARDGSFSIPIPIPADLPRGEAVVSVTGSPMDDCGKDGTGSCAGYAAYITVR
ncbi:hypothetical protein ACFVU2_02715 [Leifsonia sp. NPDC058194]|uniref:hypothetical protein n=1 Tax=Leifsonia sp. NPDC058194 TaxID=3346374 RepID=UPI0036D7EC24